MKPAQDCPAELAATPTNAFRFLLQIPVPHLSQLPREGLASATASLGCPLLQPSRTGNGERNLASWRIKDALASGA